jgi:hypothetical protein
MKHRASLFLAGLAVGFLALANCNRGDQVAPEGATIELGASPSTIVLVDGSGSADVVATVSSSVGVPLPDQDVRFSSSAGTLETLSGQPASNIPIRTDSFGNAHVRLTTTKTTTVTARSGGASGTLTLDAVVGDLQSININQESGTGCLDDDTFLTCGDELCLVAEAVDVDGAPVSGVSIQFNLEDAVNDPDGDPFNVRFTITNGTTDSSGQVHTRVQIGSSDCIDVCTGGKTCSGNVVASLRGGAFASAPFAFRTNIP